MKLTDEQIEALTALRDVMKKYDIMIDGDDRLGGHQISLGVLALDDSWNQCCIEHRLITELLNEQE